MMSKQRIFRFGVMDESSFSREQWVQKPIIAHKAS